MWCNRTVGPIFPPQPNTSISLRFLLARTNHTLVVSVRCPLVCCGVYAVYICIITSTTYFTTTLASIEINYIAVFDHLNEKKKKLPQTQYAHMFHVLWEICDLSDTVSRTNFQTIVIGLPKKSLWRIFTPHIKSL